jgi:hypothetical protein
MTSHDLEVVRQGLGNPLVVKWLDAYLKQRSANAALDAAGMMLSDPGSILEREKLFGAARGFADLQNDILTEINSQLLAQRKKEDEHSKHA